MPRFGTRCTNATRLIAGDRRVAEVTDHATDSHGASSPAAHLFFGTGKTCRAITVRAARTASATHIPAVDLAAAGIADITVFGVEAGRLATDAAFGTG